MWPVIAGRSPGRDEISETIEENENYSRNTFRSGRFWPGPHVVNFIRFRFSPVEKFNSV